MSWRRVPLWAIDQILWVLNFCRRGARPLTKRGPGGRIPSCKCCRVIQIHVVALSILNTAQQVTPGLLFATLELKSTERSQIANVFIFFVLYDFCLLPSILRMLRFAMTCQTLKCQNWIHGRIPQSLGLTSDFIKRVKQWLMFWSRDFLILVYVYDPNRVTFNLYLYWIINNKEQHVICLKYMWK